MARKQDPGKLGRVPKGSVTGTVRAVATGLNVSQSDARGALARFLRRVRK